MAITILDTQYLTIGTASSGGKVSHNYVGFSSAPVGIAGTFGNISTGISAVYPTLPIVSAYYDNAISTFYLTITGATNTGWTNLYFGSDTTAAATLAVSAATFSNGTWIWSSVTNPFLAYSAGNTFPLVFSTTATGSIGYTGSVGAQGNTGTVGPTGPQGYTGSSIKGPQGPQGVAGTAGLTGSPGPQGPQGARGNVGTVGPAGPQGPQGSIGYTGSSKAGPQGPQGPLGTQGNLGYTGSRGFGAQGPQGPAISLIAGTGISIMQSGGSTVISTATSPTPAASIGTTNFTGYIGSNAALVNGFSQAEIGYLGSGTAALTAWNYFFPPGDIRRYGATCAGSFGAYGNVYPTFGTTADSAALDIAINMFQKYGQDIIFPSGCIVTLTKKHTIQVPLNGHGRIIGYGCTVVSNNINDYMLNLQHTYISGGYGTGYGMTVQGLSFWQFGTSSSSKVLAPGAILVNGGLGYTGSVAIGPTYITIEDCTFSASNFANGFLGSASSASGNYGYYQGSYGFMGSGASDQVYAAIVFSETAPNNPNSGAFWGRVTNCRFNNNSSTGPMPIGIKLIGQCNAAIIESSVFNGVNYGIYFQPTTSSGNANGVVIRDNDFENGINGIFVNGGVLAGLRVVDNRAEKLSGYTGSGFTGGYTGTVGYTGSTAFLNLVNGVIANGVIATSGTLVTFTGNYIATDTTPAAGFMGSTAGWQAYTGQAAQFTVPPLT